MEREIIDLHGQKEFSATHHIHKTLTRTPNSAISVVGWEPGQKSPIHCHPGADEIYHVLEGEGLMEIAGKNHVVRKHDFIFLPPGVEHAISNSGLVDLVFLVVTSPVTDDEKPV